MTLPQILSEILTKLALISQFMALVCFFVTFFLSIKAKNKRQEQLVIIKYLSLYGFFQLLGLELILPLRSFNFPYEWLVRILLGILLIPILAKLFLAILRSHNQLNESSSKVLAQLIGFKMNFDDEHDNVYYLKVIIDQRPHEFQVLRKNYHQLAASLGYFLESQKEAYQLNLKQPVWVDLYYFKEEHKLDKVILK